VTKRADPAAALDRLVVAAHRQRAAAAATADGVNATDLLALTIIYRAGPITPGALARAMGFSSSGTSSVIRRVADATMIDRTTSPSDPHDVRLTPTQQGIELMTSGAGAWDAQLLERLGRRPDLGDMVDLVASVAEATEQRASALDSDSVERRRRAQEIPHLVRWG
jgi:DNA-binding MarR family transcriptional regulator